MFACGAGSTTQLIHHLNKLCWSCLRPKTSDNFLKKEQNSADFTLLVTDAEICRSLLSSGAKASQMLLPLEVDGKEKKDNSAAA